MAPSPGNPVNVRKTGLVVAVGLFLIMAGVVGLLAARRSGPTPGPSTTGTIQSPPPVMPAPPIDVTAEGLRNAGRARFQFVDKTDPNRIVGALEWAALDPLGEGRSSVSEPRATIFLDGGRLIFIRAARGRIFTPPKNEQPESGSFEGGVPMALFEPKPDGTIDVEKDRPVALLFTPTLQFNLALGEITLPEKFRLSTAKMEMSGRGLRVVGNQVDQRIELLEIESTDAVRLAGWASSPARQPAGAAPALPFGTASAPGQSVAAGTTPATPASPAATPAPTPTPSQAVASNAAALRETFYRLVMENQVRITRRVASLKADRVEIWAQFINNALPADAIGGLNRRGAAQPRVANASPSEQPAGPALAPDPTTGEPPSLAQFDDDAIKLTWEGVLRLRPLDARPEELKREAIAVRLTADRTGVVTFADEDAGLRGQAAALDYGLTTRDVTFTGNGPRSVALSADRRGRLEVSKLTINLGTGVGQAVGAGILTAAPDDRPRRAGDPAARRRQISWDEQADLVLATADDWITGSLSEAMFTGKVLGEDGRTSVSAGWAKATFAPGNDGSSRLRRIEARENVLVDPGPTESLRAQRLDVAFEPARNGRGDDPALVTASGRVSAQKDDWRIEAGLIEARVSRDRKDNLAVSSVRAEQLVRVRSSGTEITADRVDANILANTATLLGKSVAINRDGAVITGTQMALDGTKRELFVYGPGAFRFHRERPKDLAGGGGTVLAPLGRPRGAQALRVDATWTESMRIDDRAGIVEVVGQARASSNPSPNELDVLTADRLLLNFTPAPADAPALGDASRDDRRRLVRAEAIGESERRQGGLGARIESKRFAESAGEAENRTLERLVFIEGARVIANEQDSRLEVPGAGRLLIDDRRAARASGARPAESPVEFSAGRGTSLFTWNGSLTFDRLSGELQMLREVKLLSRANPEAPITTLECERLTANIRSTGMPSGGDAADLDQQTELIGAAAEGAVFLRSGERQLIADILKYDAQRNTAEAAAALDNRVSLFDPARPQPVSARRMFWDLARNRVTIEEPTPITIPR
jgi:lipopolysaccharide export system protein LptA